MTTLMGLQLPLRLLLLLLLYCLFASSEFIYKNPVHGLVACHPHQIQALLQFKDEFDSRGCNQTDYFNGVRCDNTTGVITNLQLPSGCLSGTLKPNSSLFGLHHLRFLNLSNNDFTSSSLYSGFGNLNKLEVLSLSSNGFIGQVPSSFNNLSMLSYLDLSQNELTGSFPPIQNLTKLSFLDLQNNHFSTLEPNNSLFEFHHLRYLDLSHNNFISSSLPFGFGNLNKLEVLALSYNGFVGQVPSSFNSLNRLTDLYLGYNKLTGNFPLVHNLTKLSLLHLANNDFFGTIPSSLFTMPFLSYLNLNENHFSGPIKIPNSSFSSRLIELYLRGNNFEDKILKPISKLTNLKNLGLRSLNISQPIDLSVFSSLKHLTGLDLSGNSVSRTSLSSDSGIPLSMETLVLSACNISEFPNILKPLQNLTYIDLSNNQIKGKVPTWFWSLPRLTVVVFINNFLDGFEGSEDVLLNSSVQTLFLDSNSFEGTLPNLPLSVNFFSAWNNSFKGHIPLSICDCNSLMFLDLSYSHFNGPIPPCLSNLTLLTLRKNNLEGSLPDIFYAGSSLRTLDVAYNQITGKLPKSLLNCSSLEHLSVQHNRIEDSFPFWLKALPNLKVLILRSNKLYGSLAPPHQGPLAFPELRIFEISDNNFIGSLPPSYFLNWKTSSDKMNEDGSIYMKYRSKAIQATYFTYEDRIDLLYKGLFMENNKVLTSYSTIDFSGNKIEGQIPESVGLLKGLIALNLSNNAFTGHIPLSLAKLTDLQSLDLSRNQLSGTIPNGLKSLTFLAFINVSHNQLKGEIPQGTQITGQSKSSFEGNAGLCGLPLVESCFGTDTPPPQQPREEDKEEEEEVLNWKGVAIGYGLGVLFGLAIAQIIASYKPEWLAKITCLNKRKTR